MSADGFAGLEDLVNELQAYIDQASEENISRIVEAAADEFLKDLKALPRPRSRIGGRHTHMLDTFVKKRDGSAWLLGWGVIWGGYVEKGTHKMGAQPHLISTWELNAEKYQNTMQNKFVEVR